MQKKKILYFITKGNFGGAQRYVFDLATHLPKEMFDVVVVMGKGETLAKKLTGSSIRIITIPSLDRDIRLLSDIKSFFAFLTILKQEKPNVIHLNSSKAGLFGALAGMIYNVGKTKTAKLKTIFTGHAWVFNEKRNIISKVIFSFLHYLTILSSDVTIAVSKKVAEQISVFPFVKKKISHIYNGVDPIVFKDKQTSRTTLAPLTHELWIGTIAELHTNKGLDFLIKAFASISNTVPNVALVIVGEGEERTSLTKLVRKLNIEDRVHFSGFVTDAATYLPAFNIFVLPSRTEAFPYVPLEAGLAKLPVIASRVGGIPEVIEQKRNGILVEAGNIFQIEYALQELIRSEEKRIELGTNLYATVHEHFTLEQELQRTVSHYLTTIS